jgi:hypothetical protein
VSAQPDHYHTLKVPPSASEAEIRHAYRALAKLYHPDRVPINRRGWARKQMARVNVAYETLSDPRKRARYDRLHGYTNAQTGQDTQDDTTSGESAWRARRGRERWRRRRIERWRVVALASAVTLGIGTLVTLLFVRTLPGYLLSAMVNCGALVTLLVSLVIVSR